MAGLAEELMKAFSPRDDKALKIIARRKGELTETVGQELREKFTQAFASGESTVAFAASMLASVVYLEIGNCREALQSLLDNIQIRFMMANTAAAYETVRDAALDCRNKANEIGAGDIMFPAAVTAADCSYFASEASVQSSDVGRRWMKRCLDDLEVAALLASGATAKSWLAKLASLAAQAVRDAQSLPWPDGASAIDAQLRRLASAAEQAIPIEFQFPGDAQRTRSIGKTLAELSYRYGNIDHADARIAWLTKTLS